MTRAGVRFQEEGGRGRPPASPWGTPAGSQSVGRTPAGSQSVGRAAMRKVGERRFRAKGAPRQGVGPVGTWLGSHGLPQYLPTCRVKLRSDFAGGGGCEWAESTFSVRREAAAAAALDGWRGASAPEVRTAHGCWPLEGTMQWSLRVDAMASAISVGVVLTTLEMGTDWHRPASKDCVWFYTSGGYVGSGDHRTRWYRSEDGAQHAVPKLVPGDTLAVRLDRRLLSFGVNGAWFESPVAPQRHLVTTGFVQFAVQMLQAGDKVTLLLDEPSPGTREMAAASQRQLGEAVPELARGLLRKRAAVVSNAPLLQRGDDFFGRLPSAPLSFGRVASHFVQAEDTTYKLQGQAPPPSTPIWLVMAKDEFTLVGSRPVLRPRPASAGARIRYPRLPAKRAEPQASRQSSQGV